MPYDTKVGNTKKPEPAPIPEGFQPYAIIEEKYIKSMAVPSPEDGSIIQTPSRYVEILFEDINYDFLPTEGIAIGSLAFCLDAQYMLYFSSNGYWEIVGDNGGGGNGGGDVETS